MTIGGGSGEPHIQWYPGHMAQAMRKLGERLRVVDAIIEGRGSSSSAAKTLPIRI
jgi:hypothetical protein